MGRARFARRFLIGVCGAALALSPLAATSGLAQTAAAPADDVTTVSPVTVTSMVPVPKVGDGAPYFTPEEIAQVRAQAAIDELGARRFVGASPDSEKFAGDFGAPCGVCRPPPDPRVALCRTVRNDQQALLAAADAVSAATEEAYAARGSAARGEAGSDKVEATELARQAAAKAYIAARSQAQESGARLGDYLDLERLKALGGMGEAAIYAEVDARSAVRKANGGVRVADEFGGLRLSDVAFNQEDGPKGPILFVTGKIVNGRDKAVPVPALTITATDRSGAPVKAQIADAIKGAPIPPGGVIFFTYKVDPIPPHAMGAAVNFAPAHNPAGNAPVTCAQLPPKNPLSASWGGH